MQPTGSRARARPALRPADLVAMAEQWRSWLALAGLGAFHDLNPAMGWLFALALGQHRHPNAVTAMIACMQPDRYGGGASGGWRSAADGRSLMPAPLALVDPADGP